MSKELIRDYITETIKEFITDLELLNALTFDCVDYDTSVLIKKLMIKWKERE